jgi:cyclopropane-fatty-acyl-phospholipid synthase
MKYSCGMWENASSLQAADEAMLALVCERAGIQDGMNILDVGAGFGSLAFWIADRYSKCRVTVVNRSMAQNGLVMNRAGRRGLGFVCATFDARTLDFDPIFDRVFAIEMIEHTGNPEAMLALMRRWLKPGGRVFVQAIAHKDRAAQRNLPWFEPGAMLSEPLMDSFESGLVPEGGWTIDGSNYVKTIAAWRKRLERHRREAEAALGSARRFRRWRSFLVACEEMFGWEDGQAYRVIQRLYSDGRARTS